MRHGNGILVIAAATVLLTASCGVPPAEPEPELRSLSGAPLTPPPLPDDVRAEREAKLAEARATYEADPGDADAIIWLGRRTAYLGRYREAIEIFSEGVRLHGEDPRMFRHRGHRWITMRRLDRAVADLERAAELIAGTDDEVEPDGLPNALNIPTSTLHSNVWYHLGLAHYLAGDFERALVAYRECLAVSNNPDMLVATTHWAYTTLRRLGRTAEAEQLLEPIHAGMEIIENEGYHRLLLLYRGELSEAELLGDDADAIAGATVGYGLASWMRAEGRGDEALARLHELLESPQWAAFGFIAAEADLHRLDAR